MPQLGSSDIGRRLLSNGKIISVPIRPYLLHKFICQAVARRMEVVEALVWISIRSHREIKEREHFFTKIKERKKRTFKRCYLWVG